MPFARAGVECRGGSRCGAPVGARWEVGSATPTMGCVVGDVCREPRAMVMGEWIRTAHPELAGTMVSTWATAATPRRSVCVCVNEPAGARDMRYGGVVGGAYRGFSWVGRGT